MSKAGQTYRLIKWVGEPVVLKSDGFGVASWKYENHREIAMHMPPGASGRTDRVLEAGTYKTPTGDVLVLRKTYRWTQDCATPFVTEVQIDDAMAIMVLQPYAFKDVTDLPDREWGSVRNDVRVLPAKPLTSSAPPRSGGG